MEWQPIETAPLDGTHILVYGEQFDGGCAVVFWDADYERWSMDDGINPEIRMRGDEPKHWMPLPPPPTE